MNLSPNPILQSGQSHKIFQNICKRARNLVVLHKKEQKNQQKTNQTLSVQLQFSQIELFLTIDSPYSRQLMGNFCVPLQPTK